MRAGWAVRPRPRSIDTIDGLRPPRRRVTRWRCLLQRRHRVEGAAIPPQGRAASTARQRRAAIDRRSSGAQVADYIRNLIFSGELRQGDHVRQDEIAEDLGVSRIPVREAIIVLDQEGWVTNELHRGAFVHGLDENSVRDHYGLIGLLYGYAAQRATERGDDDGLARVQTAERALRAATDPTAVRDANEMFLRQIFALARSSRLKAMSRQMNGIIPGNFFELVPGTIDLQKKGITAVSRAVRARDGERSNAAFVSLLQQHGERVVDLLRARNILWIPDEAAMS
ncbi:transcriptional regulator, GntR family [Parafrankia sp. EAN1pec]|nr:transcriptional regulator, GntR family [Frankia sp. EAN1pec]